MLFGGLPHIVVRMDIKTDIWAKQAVVTLLRKLFRLINMGVRL